MPRGAHALSPAWRRAERADRPHRQDLAMANIFVTLFAVILCLVNAVIWAFISLMPLVGVGWVAAAAGCLWLHKWSRY
jgi:hypothetical protein